MDLELMEKPINVDQLFSSRPKLFPHQIPLLEKRRTVFVGELVKIAIGVREDEGLVAGRWLIVESISHAEPDARIVGRSWKPFYKDDFWYSFDASNIYRMEPRKFYLWGTDGIPIAMRSGEDHDERTPARPLDAQGRFIEGCETVILEFAALGTLASEATYRELASRNANWPRFDALR